jgi:hypothetical protein
MILKALKLSLLTVVIAFAGARFVRADNTTNAVYGFLSETYNGVHFDAPISDPDSVSMNVWFGGGEYAQLNDQYLYKTEGNKASVFWTAGTNGWGGFGIAFKSDKDMSPYSGGSIEFDIMLSSATGFYLTDPIAVRPADIHLVLKWAQSTSPANSDQTLAVLCPSLTSNARWQHCSIPFSAIRDTNGNPTFDNNGIRYAREMNFTVAVASAQFFIDNLVWKKPGTGTMNVSVNNRFSGVTASSFTWSGVNAGVTRWKAADQFITLQADYFDSPAGNTWGIRIYTDNIGTGANPRYTGKGSPAGLICQSTTTQALPMCWRIVDVDISTTTLAIVQGTDNKLYSVESGGQPSGFPCYLWILDLNKPGGFLPADNDYAVIQDIRGIQYSEATRGGAAAPNYMYIGANFTGATTPNTYTTNRLTLELFHE